MEKNKRLIFGYSVDALDMNETVSICERALETRQRTMIGVLNAAKVVSARRDDGLLESLVGCDILLADGQSVVWASRILGEPLPERVAGIDLFERLLKLAAAKGRSVYLLGARPAVVELLAERITAEYPGITIAGAKDGYFSDFEAASIADQIHESRADMLFLGMVSPKKESFIRDWGPSLDVPIVHGVGGSFDVLAGITKRAPVRMQRLGLEWLYRLRQEPRRLWRRYLGSNTAFVMLTIRERVHSTPRHQAVLEMVEGSH